MPGAARQGSSGPVPNRDRGAPSGYRVNARRKFELTMAETFLGTKSLQGAVDVAVTELLDRLRTEPGLVEALTAAEASQRRRTGVPELPPKPGD